MDRDDLSFFDRSQPVAIFERHLPHWSQAGTICFVTWRLADSLPAAVLSQLDLDIQRELLARRLGPGDPRCAQLQKLVPHERSKLHWRLFLLRDKYLDQGLGTCPLRIAELSEVVSDCLFYFDGQRYFFTDLVVMPNHIHYLAAFPDETTFLKQNTNWKRFIARTINKKLGSSGDFWQTDQFDHLVRSQEQFEYFRKYIADNPLKAGLAKGEYRWLSKAL